MRKRQKGALLTDPGEAGRGRSRGALPTVVCKAPQFFSSQCFPTKLPRLIPRSRLAPISHEHPTWPSLGREQDAVLISQANYPETHPGSLPPPSSLPTPCSAFSVLATSLKFCRAIRDYYSLPCRKCWVERRRKEKKKKISPLCDSYMGKSYKQFRALKLMRSPANEERVNIKADCNKNVFNVYSTYLFILRKSAMLPPPHKIWPSYSASILIPCSFA